MTHEYWRTRTVFSSILPGVSARLLLACDMDNLRVEVFCSHLRVTPHIMHIDAQQVSQAVWHEDRAQVDLHHVLHAATQDADLYQLLQVNPVSQAVHVSPLHTFNTTTFHLEIVVFKKCYFPDPCHYITAVVKLTER